MGQKRRFMGQKRRFGLGSVLLVATLLCIGLPALAEGADPTAEAAAGLYDRGLYAEAGAMLAELDGKGDLDGASLYRLYYCQTVQRTGDARATLQRAVTKLQNETGGDRPALESSFYLANAYSNLAKLSTASEVATAATRAVESGKWPEPTSGPDMFRLAKLYADGGNDDKATLWFRKALPLLENGGEASAAYSRWAHRFLAERAESSGTPEEAVEQLAAMLSGEKGTQEQFDKLATMQARLGRYADAAESWRIALLRSPATGNRARYAQRLALAAVDLGGLPESTADGRRFDEMGQSDLEALLLEKAQAARTLLEEAKAKGKMSREERKVYQDRIQPIRADFFAAAMAHTLAGYPTRETAFRSGYAPMIFRKQEWLVP